MQHSVEVTDVRFAGAETATLSPAVAATVHNADALVIAPSNPIVSIGPVLAVPGLREIVEARRDQNVAVSPIIGGAALKGPADRMLRELGEESSVVGVARRYRDLASTLVIDETDRDLTDAVADAGMQPVVLPTIMKEPGVAAALARACHDAATRS
jgi:LPPG:FO 2-phospho-L-lactate transferase